jgi:hypothetical protein
LNKLNEAGCGPVRRAGHEFRCRCPAHADNGPSFYLAVDKNRILARCSAGCGIEEICTRLDHPVSDLFLDTDDPWVEVDSGFTAIDANHPANPSAPGAESPRPQAAPADTGLRHPVYSQLLTQLELSTSHFEDLRRRGLSAAEIAQRGYKTADAGKVRQAVDVLLGQYGLAELLTVPGFQERDGRVSFAARAGYLIPVRRAGGDIIALKIRHDTGWNGSKYAWVSTREVSCGSPVHVPVGIQAPAPTVRLTEGEIKSDVATFLSGLPTVSAPGVSKWPLAIPVLKALGAQTVRLAFDQDKKAGTLTAMLNALYGLTREGFEALLEWWDGRAGKGIDDALAASAPIETLTGLTAAVRVMDALQPPGPAAVESPEPDPPPFPVDVFPQGLATLCREVAEATSTPADFGGLTMLVTAGAAIGNARAVCVKQGTWYESGRFYAANVGDPACGKTPAMEAVVKPYQALQMRLLQEYRGAKSSYDEALAEYEQTICENRSAAEGERRPLPALPDEPPKPDRLVVVDVTVEGLGPILEANPRGLLIPQDEGVAWVRSMGQYKGGRGNDRQFWLSNWSGKTHIVDRKSQGIVPISIPRPFVNVICGLPPDMLNELADHQGHNDGFLHRALFAFPRATVGADWTNATVSEASRRAWENTLTGLRQLAMEELDDGVLGYRVVRFTPAAREAWEVWWNAHAAEMRGPDLPVQLVGPWGKLKSHAARLALVLHYVWLVQTHQDEGDIDVASVERAVRLINYFKEHLRLVYGRLRQTPEDRDLLELVGWIRKRGGRCTPRDLANAKKVTPTDKAKKVLKELEERGYGRIELREAKNRKQVQWFVFDPA